MINFGLHGNESLIGCDIFAQVDRLEPSGGKTVEYVMRFKRGGWRRRLIKADSEAQEKEF
jgi:hypothetical protein